MKYFEIKHIETTDLVNCINESLKIISKLEDAEIINYYPYAFFKIFIKFQNFLYKQFEEYCIGEKSSTGYCPNRRHEFNDEMELRAFLGKINDYIDYDSRIQELTDYIFIDSPFKNLFCMQPQSYNNLKAIRNYIAHESDTSLKKLKKAKIIADDNNIGAYFMKRSKKSKVHFDEIIESIYEFANYIVEG